MDTALYGLLVDTTLRQLADTQQQARLYVVNVPFAPTQSPPALAFRYEKRAPFPRWIDANPTRIAGDS